MCVLADTNHHFLSLHPDPTRPLTLLFLAVCLARLREEGQTVAAIRLAQRRYIAAGTRPAVCWPAASRATG